MPDSQFHSLSSLPPEEVNRVEQVCTEFEKAWQRRERPRIADGKARVSEAAWPALLLELVALDMRYRLRCGERPTPHDYAEHLRSLAPGVAARVEELLRAEARPPAGSDFGQETLEEGNRPAGQGGVADHRHAPGHSQRYALPPEYAEGGIGRVWRAWDRHLERAVALKEPRPDWADNPGMLARFLREARITALLEHPGVVPLHELVEPPAPGLPFYTMRFVGGRTLTEAARQFHDDRRRGQAGLLELPTLLDAFVSVCNTVAYAHSQSVLHRDLKGQNVVLGDFGDVVVLDWGMAKVLGEAEREAEPRPADSPEGPHLTVPGSRFGTITHMAPEQAAGRPDLIDRRTDVYGLGAILYEILTGGPPFSGNNREEVLQRVQEEEPAPPREAWPGVPPGLEAICLRALAKDREARWQSAAELGQQVRGWQESERRKAEKALRASEAMQRTILDSIQHSVWTATPDGRIDYVNKWGLDYGGVTLEQCLGDGWQSVIHPDDLPTVKERFTQLLQTGEAKEVKYRVRRHDGGYCWFFVWAVPVRDAEGQIVKLVGSNTEIHDRDPAGQRL